MTVEIKLEGLNARQKVLADIMWELEEYADVERFMASLPKRERIECQGIIEMMKMELVESYREGMKVENTPEANMVIQKLIDKR
jgi:predicted secreted Zn-dependent protease